MCSTTAQFRKKTWQTFLINVIDVNRVCVCFYRLQSLQSKSFVVWWTFSTFSPAFFSLSCVRCNRIDGKQTEFIVNSLKNGCLFLSLYIRSWYGCCFFGRTNLKMKRENMALAICIGRNCDLVSSGCCFYFTKWSCCSVVENKTTTTQVVDVKNKKPKRKKHAK